jgi:hypothetical protein
MPGPMGRQGKPAQLADEIFLRNRQQIFRNYLLVPGARSSAAIRARTSAR